MSLSDSSSTYLIQFSGNCCTHPLFVQVSHPDQPNKQGSGGTKPSGPLSPRQKSAVLQFRRHYYSVYSLYITYRYFI